MTNEIKVTRIDALNAAADAFANGTEWERAAAETLYKMAESFTKAKSKQKSASGETAARYAELAQQFAAIANHDEEFTNKEIAIALNLKTQRGDWSTAKAAKVSAILVDCNQAIKLENRKVNTFAWA